MSIKSFLILTFSIFIFTGTVAQAQADTLIQFSGVIRNLKYEPVPNAHVIDISRRTGTTSNSEGVFSFIVTPSDSILFRSVGYKNTLVIIPDTIETAHYPRDVYMLNDTIHLAEVKIFPWKTYEDFKVAFLNLELPDQDHKNAVKNIELIKAQLNMDFEPDADLSYKNAMNQQYEKLYYNGQYPTIPILNPFNWAKFFQALKSGDFKNKEKK
ncbi:MAG TPA: hypothetical protein VE870_10640 [Bacteroidales bacterium]|nr:hypothetical protein [Bacteroidales bacterium]